MMLTDVLALLALPAIALTVTGVALFLVARPWELRGGSWPDKLKVAHAVINYDFWLDVFGVGGRRRRELRAELRGNLWEAARQVGGRQAIHGVGSVRRLARQTAVESRREQGWSYGVMAGMVAFSIVLLLQLVAATVVADSAHAAAAGRLSVPVTLLPGTEVTYESLPHGGFVLAVSAGFMPLVVAVVVFAVASRPWLLLRRSAGVPA